jgi:hypothetical protein
VEIISFFPSLERELILNPSWDYDKLHVYKLIKSLEEYQTIVKDLKRFRKDALDEDLPTLLTEFQGQKKKILKFLSGDFKKVKKKISRIYVDKPPENDEQILDDLEELIRCQKLQSPITLRLPLEGRKEPDRKSEEGIRLDTEVPESPQRGKDL